VALENYTRGQKIFMVTLIVVLAAMFTVTGAMLSLSGQGQTAPADHGRIDGRAIRMVEFGRMRRALGIIGALDTQAQFGAADAPEHIYARVPSLAVQEHYGHDWPYNAQRPVETSLLEIWPSYQDQNIWCHIVLAQRAREKGITERGDAYIGRVLTALMNQNRQEIDKFTQKDLSKRFAEMYGNEIDELLPTIREALMVRDYVDSLIADERARLAQVASIAGGNQEELKAEYARLKIGFFMDRARQDVLRDNFRHRSSGVASGFGAATLPVGYDGMEEAYDKNRSKTLSSEAQFGFEIIMAYPDLMVNAGSVPFEKELLELIYRAVRDEMFKASDADKTAIEQRLGEEYNRYTRDNAEETRAWGEAEKKTFFDKQRPDMLSYRSFYEAEVDLKDALMRKESLKAAQASISGFQRYVEEQKAERTRLLAAQIDVIRKQEAVWEGQRGYVEDLRSRMGNMEMQLHGKARGITNQLDISTEGANADENSAAVQRIVDEFVRELANFDREQIESLMNTARAILRPLESDLNNKRAELEEFTLEKEHLTPDGVVMTPEEVTAKTEQFNLEIKAIEEKIRLRDLKVPQLETFAEDLRALLARYELVIRNARDGDLDLRRHVLRELVVEIPIEIGALIRERRDAILPESEIDDYRTQAELVRADHQARQRNQQKDAADTRKWNLDQRRGDRPSVIDSFGLKLNKGLGNTTWPEILASGEFGFLDNVDGARQFLEDPSNAAGATSRIMAVPGKGYIILRLAEKTPKYPYGRADARDTVITIAAMKRARELTVEAMEELRREILKDGWSTAIDRAKVKYGAFFEVQQTPFFDDKMDIPGLHTDSDNDVLELSSSPTATSPDQPFTSRIKDIDPSEGVTEVISERHNVDELRRPEKEEWAYLLARVVERRLVERRLSKDAIGEDRYGSTPAEVWRNRHLAASEAVRLLISPSDVLADHEIIQYKQPEADDNTANEE
jgi:hypothetical protein